MLRQASQQVAESATADRTELDLVQGQLLGYAQRHGTWEGDESEVRRLDPETGTVLEKLRMPAGTGVTGLEADGGDQFFCGGGRSGTVRAIRRPGRVPQSHVAMKSRPT